VDLELGRNSRALITSVAAQKVYGSIGRSRLHPKGTWANQSVSCRLSSNSDLEWLPQELVVYADALVEQNLDVQLADDASFLSAEIVRLGRTAAGEDLGQGCWRSAVSLRRIGENGTRWEQVDRLELSGDALHHRHGLNGDAVFGTLIWAAPAPLTNPTLQSLLSNARNDRAGLEGQMQCSGLEQGLIARYVGPSSRDARFWFSRIWARTRAQRQLSEPRIPRVWPLQEQPLRQQVFIENIASSNAATH
jgi:urease accessory protein